MNKSVTGVKHNNVYITPSQVEFTEAAEGISYRQCITIKNVGNRSAFIRIRQPNSIGFEVETWKSNTQLSPGLSLTACVSYTFRKPSLLHAIIPIEIDGKVLDYRVVCTLAAEGISIEPRSIDFGIIDLGYKSVSKIITIRNKGGKSTRKIDRFSIDLGQSDLEVSVKPLRGTVRPSREMTLRVELVGTYEGVFYSEFWIKSVPNIRVPIKVNVIAPRLVVYHPNTTGCLTLVDFSPTIEDTSRYDTFVLRNLSSRVVSYVVLAEMGNEVKCIRDIDHERHPSHRVFKIRPIEGLLDPFQGVIFEIEFSPTSKLSRQERTKRERKCPENGDFIAFIRIVKVHCAESGFRRLEMEDSLMDDVQPSFKLHFDVKVDSYSSTASRRCIEKRKIGSYTVDCAVNIILKSKLGFLSRRSLPIKAIDNDEEIMRRILRTPKWKHDDYPVDRLVCRVKKPILERSICTRKAAVLIPLSPLQIYNIHIRPSVFAFGMVAPNSLNYRQLVARNTNDIPVMIRLTSSPADCIRFPESDLMILPPNSTSMTKLVEYHAKDIGKFNGCIGYVINNNHFFDLNVTAYVVHKQLHIDKREIELGKEWSSEEAYRPLASVICIKNKLGARTCFRWEVPSASGFYIEPTSGAVRGDAILHVYAHYVANNHAKVNSVQAIVKCESGSCGSLRLSIPRLTPKVEFVNDHVNLGEIPLNLPTKVIAILRNFDINEVAYEVDKFNISTRIIKSSWLSLQMEKVHLTFDICCNFSAVIAVMIQGSARLTYKINGKVSFPRLKLQPERIEMKRVSVDACQTHRITATNIGTTILEVQFLLKKYPEFRISLSVNGQSSDMENIIIVPGASRSFYLHFEPVDLASYAFYLPMMINQLLGPVSALSVRPSEFLKSREIRYANLSNFVITPLPDKLPTLSEELCIENRVTRTTVLLNIEEFSQSDCPFTIEWSRGAEVRRTSDSIECALYPGDSVHFVLEFKPKKRGSFSVEAPIHVHGGLDVFNKLRLDGEFPASTIDVEPTEIYLTPVPLGMAIGRRFMIRARHFDNSASIGADFSSVSRCRGDYKNDLIRVDFPNGVLPHSCIELEGTVTFKSDQPVSFCLTIEFRDDRATSVCRLKVHATADNNLLTIYQMRLFDDAKRVSIYSSPSSNNETGDRSLGQIIDSELYSSRNEEIYTNDDEMVGNNVQTDKKETTENERVLFREREIDSKKHFAKLSHQDYFIDDRVCGKYIHQVTISMEEWMYSGPLRFRFYLSIPHGITAAFSNYSVKRKSNVGYPKRKDNATIPSFIDVLESLVGSKIRDYLGEHLPKQCELHERSIHRSIVNSSSKKLDNRCPEESFLLAWLQYHYEQQRVRDWMTDHRLNSQEKLDEPRLVQNFHRDLSDSLVLIALTAAYCPFLIRECFGNFYIRPRNSEETLHNAICLVTAWRKIRVGFIITPMQLVNPNEIQMLMLVTHLFQTLPTYVPNAKENSSRLMFLTAVLHEFILSSAYLLFCGCAIGPYFGSNQCIVLEGQIDNVGIIKEYTVRSKLYEVIETSLRINVPYRNAAEYEIWLTEKRPNHPYTHIGLRLIQWLMGDDIDSTVSEFAHIFDNTVTYKVAISDKSSPLVIPEYFTIEGR
ncbi:PREDICTED: uncharacterized protein LOC106746645 [Dinoponera quadriceps]|uniref:Uncharacterized protein LOC106746645 n=1 Tax=Dinoponera quadriceps TaxID=609295 RepID=A0A6P3XKY4_DINQU|nr:PREDICTED: uncharacterized protein LOC106746645 [Dinoponera quadriceps]